MFFLGLKVVSKSSDQELRDFRTVKMHMLTRKHEEAFPQYVSPKRTVYLDRPVAGLFVIVLQKFTLPSGKYRRALVPTEGDVFERVSRIHNNG